MVDDCASERCVRWREQRPGRRWARGCHVELGAPARPGRPGTAAGLAAFPCRQPAASLCAPRRDPPRSPRSTARRVQNPRPAAGAAPPAPSHVSRCRVWWSAPGGGRGGRWRRAGAARARPGAAFAARGGAGTPRRAPVALVALMEPPWELELELRRHIENCSCTCDHMGYGNYMDYQVAPGAHACLCRAITSPHAHVCVNLQCSFYPRPPLANKPHPAWI